MKQIQLKDQKGFTLVEMAFTILVVSLIMIGVVQSYNVFEQKEELDQNTETLSTVYDQLSEFLTENGRYPCPASLTSAPGAANYGNETNCADISVVAGACDAGNNYCVQQSPRVALAANPALARVRIGALPHNVLSMDAHDAYDSRQNKIYYAVMESLTDTNTYRETLGGIQILDDQGNVLDDKASYIVFNSGENEIGAYSYDGNTRQACAGSAAEVENCDFLTNVASASFVFGAQANVANANMNDDMFQKETYSNNNSQIGWVFNDDLIGTPGSDDVVILNRNVRLGVESTPTPAGQVPIPLTAEADLHLGEVGNDLGNLIVSGDITTNEYCALDAAGDRKCFNLADLSTGECPDGQYVTGIRAGRITCGVLYFGCNSGEILIGKHPDDDIANPDAGRPICVDPAGRVPVAAVTPVTPTTPVTTPTPSNPGTPGNPINPGPGEHPGNGNNPGDCDPSDVDCNDGGDGDDGADGGEDLDEIDPQTCLPDVSFTCNRCDSPSVEVSTHGACVQGVSFEVYQSIQVCETFGGAQVLGDPIPTGGDNRGAGCCTLEPISNEIRDSEDACGPNFTNSSAHPEVRQTLDIQSCQYVENASTKDYTPCGGCVQDEVALPDTECTSGNIAGAMVKNKNVYLLENACVPELDRDATACGCVPPDDPDYAGVPFYPTTPQANPATPYYNAADGYLYRELPCTNGREGSKIERAAWNSTSCGRGSWTPVSNDCACPASRIAELEANVDANPYEELSCGSGGVGIVSRARVVDTNACAIVSGALSSTESDCAPRPDEFVSERDNRASASGCGAHETLSVCGKREYTQSFECLDGILGRCGVAGIRDETFTPGTCVPAAGRLVTTGAGREFTNTPGELEGSNCELESGTPIRTCSVPAGAGRWQTFVCECSRGSQPSCTAQP